MTNQHPITPPPELVQQWLNEPDGIFANPLATQAARWGADQELEACCDWLEQHSEQWRLPYSLRTARRPKPPTLKEQALKALHTSVDLDEFPKQYDTIRKALEALPND
jgi:hypothetical protein